jgi:hypothetical protein
MNDVDATPLAEIQFLCKKRNLVSESMFPDCLELPFVRDIQLRSLEIYFVDFPVTHFVGGSQVWRINENHKDKFWPPILELKAEWPQFRSPASAAWVACLELRRQADAIAWGLAEAGCERVWRVWRTSPTLLESDCDEPVAYAELAAFGDGPQD